MDIGRRLVTVLLATGIALLPGSAGAESAFLVADVARGAAGSFPREVTPFGSVAIFSANDENGDDELWRTDGTAAGTFRVADIHPTDSSFPSDLTVAGGIFFFVADDGVTGQELWKTDGTAAGTVQVKDIRPGPDGSSAAGLVAVGDLLLFRADDGESGFELWRSDGTAAGTVLVEDIQPGQFGSLSFGGVEQIVAGDTLFFFADDGTNGRELWKSDGTDLGTMLVRNIAAGAADSEPFFGAAFGALDDTVFFFADDGVVGEELWKSNGTFAGTVLVKDIRTGSGDSFAFPSSSFARMGDALFFTADEATAREELWRTDGTPMGTVLVADIAPGTSQSSPEALTALGDVLLFAASQSPSGRELWRSDGTAMGTALVRDIFPGVGSGSISRLHARNGAVFFDANDGVVGRELWRSDGTTVGTALAADILPGPGGSDPQDFISFAGMLLFTADDGVVGRELWVLTSCGDGTVDAGETCDDGNRVDDCCSASCVPASAGVSCDGGDACTTGRLCDGSGACGGGAPLSCDDGNACTLDACAPASGCAVTPVGFDTLAAVFAAGLGGACPGTPPPASLTKLFGAAGATSARAAAATGAKRRRLLRSATRRLTQGERKAGKQKKLDPACRAALAAPFAAARAQAGCLAAAP